MRTASLLEEELLTAGENQKPAFGERNMIRKVHIENFKSITDLTLELGRVNVLIGVNGSGKSNILEAIALASAASQGKLENEFLISRGIRVTDTTFMKSAFGNSKKKRAKGNTLSNGEDVPVKKTHAPDEAISISVEGDRDVKYLCELIPDETTSYPRWKQRPPAIRNDSLANPINQQLSLKEDLNNQLIDIFNQLKTAVNPSSHQRKSAKNDDVLSRPDNRKFSLEEDLNKQLFELFSQINNHLQTIPIGTLPDFLIFAPENSSLRTFQSEGQILPLGIRGEGLFAHLKGLDSEKFRGRLELIKERLKLIDWFDSFVIPEQLSPGERAIKIRDRYLAEGLLFDQRSANEGFLYLLFYITLLMSPETPRFFAIDNVDNSLNPKMCVSLVEQIVALTKEFERQVILTTHNPATLDGLDLTDPEQRLFVVDRNKNGETRITQVQAPKTMPGTPPVSLSEAFMRGYIGGLPKHF